MQARGALRRTCTCKEIHNTTDGHNKQYSALNLARARHHDRHIQTGMPGPRYTLTKATARPKELRTARRRCRSVARLKRSTTSTRAGAPARVPASGSPPVLTHLARTTRRVESTAPSTARSRLVRIDLPPPGRRPDAPEIGNESVSILQSHAVRLAAKRGPSRSGRGACTRVGRATA